jgi:hypothetical protein
MNVMMSLAALGMEGWVMQSRSKWLLATCAFVIVAGGVAFLWLRSDPSTAHSLWFSHGTTVLQYGLPPLLALLGWTGQQLIGSRSERSTPEQLALARKALAGRGLEWWRGVPEPAWPGQVLRAGLRPLNVEWSERGVIGRGRVHGSTDDIKGMAERFRKGARCRLVICGEASSGKSVLARLLMAELLSDLREADPVPVFLPLWSWNPAQERMHDWMKRRIRESYPELLEEAIYGPTAVAGLVDQGIVLPILDGLDALPPGCRQAVVADGELMSQLRLILTCREDIFGTSRDFVVISPRTVTPKEAGRFLTEVTGIPRVWERFPLPEIPSDPRTIYLASMVYGSSGNKLAQLAQEPAGRPARHTARTKAPAARGELVAATKKFLAGQLVGALMPASDGQDQGFPWYPGSATRWLSSLAKLDLRDPADRPGSTSTPDPDRRGPADRPIPGPPDNAYLLDPGNSRIAWWNLHRSIKLLRRHQAVVRALAVGLATFVIITAIFLIHPGWTYSLMTAGGYAAVVFIAAALLGDPSPANPAIELKGASVGGRISWSIRHAWTRWWRLVMAAVGSFCCFAILIGVREGLSNGRQVGTRVGIYDALTIALLVVITFIVAGVPTPPRTIRASDYIRPSWSPPRAFATALMLGIPFGVLWGATAVLKHQTTPKHPLSYQQVILTGLITGIDFVLGAWLYRWSGNWFKPGRGSGPRSIARADLLGALVRPLILGFTFAFAFGISAPFHFTGVYVGAWLVVGLALGSLGTEWPLYLTTITRRAVLGKTLPIRLLRFLECCRACGLVRVVGQEYQIHDPDLLEYLVLYKEPEDGKLRQLASRGRATPRQPEAGHLIPDARSAQRNGAYPASAASGRAADGRVKTDGGAESQPRR